MLRSFALAALMLAVTACAAKSTPRYVVRLDLDRIAAQTASKDSRPGFSELDDPAPSAVNPS